MDLVYTWELVGALVAISIVLVTYFKWRYTYWAKRNVPYLTPTIPFGTMQNPLLRNKSLGQWIKQNYDELKSNGYAYGGLYNYALPAFLPVSLEQVKNIMQKDFQYFTDRGLYYNEKADPLSAHLFALGGQKWRNLRTKLTPTFTSGKMKMMFDTLVECSHPMTEIVTKFAEKKRPMDIKEVVARFTTDVIGSCAFGLECNSFKSTNAEFRKCGSMIFERSILRQTLMLLLFSRPSLGEFLGIRVLPKSVSNFFFKTISDTVKYREENKVSRKDMLDILLELKKKNTAESEKKHDGSSLSIEELAAQAFVFFVAGFETSSTTMTFCLFELATDPELQDKVRAEIKQVLAKHDGKITYESIMDMKYMTQVVEETLRKYPPVPQITRKCVKDYKIPDSDVVIEQGTTVFISPLGLHYDPEYFPNPEKFDPERFSPENKDQIPQFAYIPFGEGPRICIGMRFGMMQTKVGLAVLLKDFEVTLSNKTILPLEIDPSKPIYSTKNTILLNVTNLNPKVSSF